MPSSAASPGSKKWIIVSLTSVGEKEASVESLKRSIRNVLKSPTVEVFVPASTQKARDESHTFFYMHGYVFIEFHDGAQYLKLQDTAYFSQVLCEPKRVDGRMTYAYSLLDDSQLDSMRSGVESLGKKTCSVGDRVKVVQGAYKNLCGDVVMVYEEGKTVQVSVSLRSKKLLIDFPATYLTRIAPDG